AYSAAAAPVSRDPGLQRNSPMLILFEVSSESTLAYITGGTMQKFRFSNPIHCQSAVLIRLGRGVRPWSWTGSRGGFDPLPGVVILELRGVSVAERGVQPASVVDLVNERITCRG